MNHVMLDLETLGRGAGCSILSIGAVQFDPKSGQLGEEFYAVISRASCQMQGLVEDEATLDWWMEQPEEARKVLLDCERKGAYTLNTALILFRDYLATVGGAKSFEGVPGYHKALENVQLWGNGADFDNAILAYAYQACHIEQPWKFWNNRCYRTLKNLFNNVRFKRRGVHHNALDDAKSQAEHAIEILRYADWERSPKWLQKVYWWLRKNLFI